MASFRKLTRAPGTGNVAVDRAVDELRRRIDRNLKRYADDVNSTQSAPLWEAIGNGAVRSYTQARQYTVGSGWEDIASVKLTTYGEPISIDWFAHVIGQHASNRCDWRLTIDGSATMNTHEAYIYEVTKKTTLLADAANPGMDHLSLTWGNTSQQLEYVGTVGAYTGVSAPPTHNWARWGGFIPMLNVDAGDHVIKMQQKATNASWVANARDVTLNVAPL